MAGKPWHRGPWPKVRRMVLNRDGHRCQIQGPNCTGQANHVDHIVSPMIDGAWFDPTNLRASCPTCNLERAHQTSPRSTYPTASRDW
jgi:5-methylcytosine-specific restriction endonuclease McrA